jgi:hypothetical protein
MKRKSSFAFGVFPNQILMKLCKHDSFSVHGYPSACCDNDFSNTAVVHIPEARRYICFQNFIMKSSMLILLVILALQVSAQDKEKVQAAKGVVYGTVAEETAAISPDEIQNKLVNDQFQGQIKGKVVEVCMAEGCWIRLQKKDGSSMMVRARDHAFLMPENIVGKTVLVEGTASVKEISETMRKHFAEDAGKPKSEIEKIKGAEKDVQFAAKGVKVLD